MGKLERTTQFDFEHAPMPSPPTILCFWQSIDGGRACGRLLSSGAAPTALEQLGELHGPVAVRASDSRCKYTPFLRLCKTLDSSERLVSTFHRPRFVPRPLGFALIGFLATMIFFIIPWDLPEFGLSALLALTTRTTLVVLVV